MILKRPAIMNFISTLFIALLVFAIPAQAHKLMVFAYQEGTDIKGESYFSDGSPAINCPAKLLDGDGNVLAEGKTDRDGTFSIPLPTDVPSSIIAEVEGGMGHLGQMQLNIEGIPSASAGTNTPETKADEGSETAKAPAAETATVTPVIPTAPPAPSVSEEEFEKLVNKAVKTQMDPMLHQLMEIKMELSKPRLTEIMGGIGYIAGLTGLILWALGNKKRNG